MPIPVTSKLLAPKSPDEFEDICLEVIRRYWRCPHAQRNGRSGQGQGGIDIYGIPYWLKEDGAVYAGVQCKNVNKINSSLIENEVEKAKGFRLPLAEYWVLTTTSRDTVIQSFVDTQNAASVWPFHVHVWWWEDIAIELVGHADLLAKFYPHLKLGESSQDDLFRLILESDPQDWEYLGPQQELYLKRRPTLRIELDDEDLWKAYRRKWVQVFPDPEAFLWQVHIKDGENVLKNISFVAVDGGLCSLPLPMGHDVLTITEFEYQVGRVINTAWMDPEAGAAEYEKDLDRAHIRVVHDDLNRTPLRHDDWQQ